MNKYFTSKSMWKFVNHQSNDKNKSSLHNAVHMQHCFVYFRVQLPCAHSVYSKACVKKIVKYYDVCRDTPYRSMSLKWVNHLLCLLFQLSPYIGNWVRHSKQEVRWCRRKWRTILHNGASCQRQKSPKSCANWILPHCAQHKAMAVAMLHKTFPIGKMLDV